MKSNSSKILKTFSIFATISLILVFCCILPLINGIKKNSEGLISAKNDLISLAEQINATKVFQKNYETYKPDLDKLDQLFVDPNDPVNFIEFIEGTAAGSGVTSQISLPSASDKSQQAAIFQVSSNGGISKILSFIKKIESGPYLVEIENLILQYPSINVASKDKLSNDGNARFTIKTFVKK